MFNNIGASLYFAYGTAQNKANLTFYKSHGISKFFSSLHIPEERYTKEEVFDYLNLFKQAGVDLILDISNNTLTYLGIEDFSLLKTWGVKRLRLDFGFSFEEILELSQHFELVFNASTLEEDFLQKLKEKGLDLEKLYALHNFYPKVYTGLSERLMEEKQALFQRYGVKSMAFIAIQGDKSLKRGPFYRGLPTLEKHRKLPEILQYLDLIYNYGVDEVYFGDPGLTDSLFQAFEHLRTEGVLELPCTLEAGYEALLGRILSDRPDYSDHVFRASETRGLDLPSRTESHAFAPAGSILLSNAEVPRYEHELSIALQDLSDLEYQVCIGQVDKAYLPYLRCLPKLRLISKENMVK